MVDVRRSEFNIKNHIEKVDSYQISSVMGDVYGLSVDDIKKALEGNQESIALIGEAGRQGRLTAELAPLIEENSLQAIEGTVSYNKVLGSIIQKGAQGALQINQTSINTELGGLKYTNAKELQSAKYQYDVDAIKSKHSFDQNYLQAGNMMSEHIVGVERTEQMRILQNRPEVLQASEDERYNLNYSKALLSSGNNTKVEFIQHRQYTDLEVGGNENSFGSKFRGFLKAIGF